MRGAGAGSSDADDADDADDAEGANIKMTDLMSGPALDGRGDEVRLSAAQLRRVKHAYTTRYVGGLQGEMNGGGCRLTRGAVPHPGDVVLATVEVVGLHKRLETPESRRSLLFPGDMIMVAYGHRYAPDQFEAEVRADLGDTHLVAAGGVAGTVTAAYHGLEPPTVIRPVGLLTRPSGVVVNLGQIAPLRVRDGDVGSPAGPPVVAVVGTSMNSGKSTALASLAYGLSASGLQVAAGKVTGTGAGGDVRLFSDGGAFPVVDFTDFGFASTYRLEPATVRGILVSMLVELAMSGPDVILLEIADGVYQQETARLLEDRVFARHVDRVVFAASDALGAHAGVQMLASHGLTAAAVTGRVTSSPLAVREAQALLAVPVHTTDSLTYPETASSLLHGCR
jgi:hypothetical protein